MTTTLVIDTSAAVAILTGERSADELIERLDDADARLMSTTTLVELGIVMEARLGPAAEGIVERFLRDGEIELVPVDRTHVDRALEGWRRCGKGRHKAALNYGDCFSYALAIAGGHPLLFVGDDFPAHRRVVARRRDELTTAPRILGSTAPSYGLLNRTIYGRQE